MKKPEFPSSLYMHDNDDLIWLAEQEQKTWSKDRWCKLAKELAARYQSELERDMYN